VKIRGFRIELGEIETVLNEHDSVREAVVVAREDVPGDKRLVAYLIPKTGQKIVSKELRHFLRTELPEFMVPSHFIKMDSFPLTPNKKTDRKALPAPDQVASETNVAYMAPTNDLERKVAEIWQRLLNVNQVGLNDNFFDLGGHSLLTVQAHRQLKAVVDREISITDMFRFPTIRSLVAYLSEDTNGSNGTKKSAVAKSSDRAATRREALKQRQHRRRR
jgi:acyl carrier protein